MGVRYATREQLRAALDIAPGFLENARIDRLIEAASRDIERSTHRFFYPSTDAKTFGPFFGGDRLRLMFDLRSISSITVDGTAVAASKYVLEPRAYGPPYGRLDFTEGQSGGDVVITGEWGATADTEPAGDLDAAITDTTGTTIDVSDSGKIGIGDLITIDSERFIVTDKALLDTTTNINGALSALDSETSIPFEDTGTLVAGEVITVDSERMFIESISGSVLTVQRAVEGSTLAAHLDDATISAPRTLTVTRGAAGSTAATHLIDATITRNVPPGQITELCVAEVIAAREQEMGGYGRTIGQGEQAQEQDRRALYNLRNIVADSWQRLRTAAV